ncbi:DUF2381 family protein [Archangium sp.]|uniref:DUF2381 family protein n=1 Tax=Archangium sp. TaxID=1872627 RepID=UPI002D4F49E2|nr:DUF2381 family protein [Archangium sp.]HYO54664.1 DUF2381 family protein [Archangium sp.]
MLLPSILVLLQGSPIVQSAAACEDSQRIELALTPAVAAREVCVSPGIMTGFIFDSAPVFLELQDEVRFVEVQRGRLGISFVPPGDMMPGERLRLTARLGTGVSQEIITFMLVAHRGQATRQVEVYRDKRTRESYQQEADQERAKNHQLRQENQQLRAQLEQHQGLRSLIANKMVGPLGIQTLALKPDEPERPDRALSFRRGVSYRTEKTVAAEVWVRNSSSEPWTATGASLVGANGKEMPGIRLRQEEAIAPDKVNSVIVEVDATRIEARGDLELRLWDAGSRAVTIPRLRFP